MHATIPLAAKPRRAGTRPAFTLIELLTVIAVIAILAAIVISSVGRVRQAAENAQCLSRLRSLGLAGLACIEDNRGLMFDAMHWWNTPTATRRSVQPYLDIRPGQMESGEQTPLSCPSAFKTVGPNPFWSRGYSINIYACGWENGGRESPYDRHATQLQQIQNPAAMAFFMDGNFLSNGVPERKMATTSVVPWNPATNTGMFVHGGGRANIVHMDGHVSSRGLGDFPQGSHEDRRRDPFWGSLR